MMGALERYEENMKKSMDEYKKKKSKWDEEPVVEEAEEVVEEAPVVEEKAYVSWIGTVACDNASLNVRSGPGIEFENIKERPTVKRGSEIEVVGESGDWYNVNVDGHLGFVMAKYVSKPKYYK